jgi:2-polyprenyl-6-hydroxyphenyl methylase/3-demethylubiquinone-9 3-methyltransferase
MDPLEIQKFSELAHRWWDPTSEFRPLHEINPLRLEWINARVALNGKNVIDIGCGGGVLSESMARKGAKVTGIDLSKKALKVADLHSLESGVEVRYKLIAAEDMAFEEPGQFDVVTCMEMLEHVPDPAAIVRAAATLVKPGGHVFFSTLNRNAKSYLFARHPRLRQVHHAGRAVRLRARCRPAGRRAERHDLQPADQDLFAEPGHRRELHGGLQKTAVMIRVL